MLDGRTAVIHREKLFSRLALVAMVGSTPIDTAVTWK
jgi:hypothetical protein